MSKHAAKHYFDEQGRLIIQPYYISDLAIIYGINRKTMCKWMGRFPKQLAQKEGKHFSIHQVRFMIQKFGLPSHGMAV